MVGKRKSFYYVTIPGSEGDGQTEWRERLSTALSPPMLGSV